MIESVVLVGLVSLVLLCALTVSTRTIMFLEKATGWYPIVSEQTIERKAAGAEIAGDFYDACEEDRAVGRDGWYVEDCDFADDPTHCREHTRTLDAQSAEATAEMLDAVDRRKALSRELDLNWLQSALVGTTGITHSTWLCPSPHASFDGYQISVGFTRTDKPTS